MIRNAGHRIDPISTTAPGTAADIARRAIDHGADLILVAGGDGTVNEVVNGMVRSRTPLGILPGGTANVLAMETGIGKRMLAAASELSEWPPERVTVGVHDDGDERPPRYFLLMCGAGLDAHIVYHLSASLKTSLGKYSYWLAGFSQIGRRFPEFEVEANGTVYRASFALASRVRNYGGDLEIARRISLLEDDFELVLFSGESSFRYLRYIASIVRGRLDKAPGVTILRTPRVIFKAPEDRRIYTQVDGEYAGPLPVRLAVEPRALTLLLPSGYRMLRAASAREKEWITSPTR